jgi:hypothetical protein
MKIHIELEDNIVKPCKKTSFLNSETKKTLQSMEKGQSFIVKNQVRFNTYKCMEEVLAKDFLQEKFTQGKGKIKTFILECG